MTRGNDHTLRNPLDGCFFCDPEPWRLAYQASQSQVLAGAGPLCPGYVLVASRRHVHSVAQLTAAEFAEFISVFHSTTAALETTYGAGYLAYEHGRLGSCRMLEAANDYSTFCHHAHRVVIPKSIDILTALTPHFAKVERLAAAAQLLQYDGQEYVFYETGRAFEPPQRYVLTAPRNVQSQFMRRILTNVLRTGRDWNWAGDLCEEEMAQTACYVRRALSDQAGVRMRDSRRLTRSVAIDGLSHVGKTSVARGLAGLYGRPVLDTGYFFRGFAFARLNGFSDPSAEMLMPLVVHPDERLRSVEVTRLARETAADPAVRAMYSECVRNYIDNLRPCLVVGRDAWRHVRPDEPKLLIEADLETRIHRRALELTARGELAGRAEAEREIEQADYMDRPKLPPSGHQGLTRIWNDDAPLQLAVQRAVAVLKEFE